MTLAAA